MRRFILLTVLCCLALGMSAQTAKEEIFADVHRSAANYYAYPQPSAVQTAPPAGYKPFYLSHYARHGSRYLINPADYEKPLEILTEADRNNVLTNLGRKTLLIVDSVAHMARSRWRTHSARCPPAPWHSRENVSQFPRSFSWGS